MTEKEIILYVCIFAIAVFAIFFTLFQRLGLKAAKEEFAEDDIQNCKKITEYATVISKIPSETVMGITIPCKLMFENSKGARKTFAIKDGTTFFNCVIGDEGELTYAGRAFIEFIRINKEKQNEK